MSIGSGLTAKRDDEWNGQTGASYTTDFRQYDPRIARWLSIDPLFSYFPWQSLYVAFDNNPIYYKDPKGAAAEDTEGGGDGRKKTARQIARAKKIGNQYSAKVSRIETKWINNGKDVEDIDVKSELYLKVNNSRLGKKHLNSVSTSTGWPQYIVTNPYTILKPIKFELPQVYSDGQETEIKSIEVDLGHLGSKDGTLDIQFDASTDIANKIDIYNNEEKLIWTSKDMVFGPVKGSINLQKLDSPLITVVVTSTSEFKERDGWTVDFTVRTSIISTFVYNEHIYPEE